jgi:hypothetical protein
MNKLLCCPRSAASVDCTWLEFNCLSCSEMEMCKPPYNYSMTESQRQLIFKQCHPPMNGRRHCRFCDVTFLEEGYVASVAHVTHVVLTRVQVNLHQKPLAEQTPSCLGGRLPSSATSAIRPFVQGSRKQQHGAGYSHVHAGGEWQHIQLFLSDSHIKISEMKCGEAGSCTQFRVLFVAQIAQRNKEGDDTCNTIEIKARLVDHMASMYEGVKWSDPDLPHTQSGTMKVLPFIKMVETMKNSGVLEKEQVWVDCACGATVRDRRLKDVLP